jgi:hypothetical protein
MFIYTPRGTISTGFAAVSPRARFREELKFWSIGIQKFILEAIVPLRKHISSLAAVIASTAGCASAGRLKLARFTDLSLSHTGCGAIPPAPFRFGRP